MYKKDLDVQLALQYRNEIGGTGLLESWRYALLGGIIHTAWNNTNKEFLVDARTTCEPLDKFNFETILEYGLYGPTAQPSSYEAIDNQFGLSPLYSFEENQK